MSEKRELHENAEIKLIIEKNQEVIDVMKKINQIFDEEIQSIGDNQKNSSELKRTSND